MSFRDDVLASLDHHQPAVMPVDFGATAVTGMHVSVVAELREHFGLERRPVKIHEPFQMLGFVDDDLADAMHVSPRSRANMLPEEYLRKHATH